MAGSGLYVLGRVLGLGILGCAMAATVYELSGTFMGWLGWPVAGVMSWAGWLLAAAILVMRGRRRGVARGGFAVVFAFALYAGHPETVVLLGVAVVVFLVVFLVVRRLRPGVGGPVLRPAFDLVVAAVIGLALAAPLVLPGVQVIVGSINNVRGLAGINRQAIPLHDFMGYLRAMGVIGVALVITAVAWRWRRASLVAFLAAALVMALLAFSAPVESVMNRLPFLGNVHWEWATVAMVFALAVPAGVGLDVLVRSHVDRRVRLGAAMSFVVACVVLLTVPATGRLGWPVAQVVLGLAVVGLLTILPRRWPRPVGAGPSSLPRLGRWAGLALLATETVFLAASVAPLWKAAPIPLSPPPRGGFAWALKQDVGTAVLGLGTQQLLPQVPGHHPEREPHLWAPGVRRLRPGRPPCLLRLLDRRRRHPRRPVGVPVDLLPGGDLRPDGPPLRRGVRHRADRLSRPVRGGVREEHQIAQRRPLPDPRGGGGHVEPPGRGREPARAPRTRRRGGGRPSRARVVEAHDRCTGATGASVPAHRRAGLARQHRRAAAPPESIRRRDAPGPHPPRPPPHRAALLARHVQPRPRRGRRGRRGPRRPGRLRCTAPAGRPPYRCSSRMTYW